VPPGPCKNTYIKAGTRVACDSIDHWQVDCDKQDKDGFMRKPPKSKDGAGDASAHLALVGDDDADDDAI